MTSKVVQYRRYGGPEVLELVDREDPTPGPGQVRVAVRAAAVNPLDWKLRGGGMASGDAPDEPQVPGYDVAGVVDALGEGVTAFAVGDEVVGKATGGGYAEEVVADVRALVRKPAEVAWETAAALPVVATTAYRALALLGLGEGDHTGTTIVIDGAAGAVGVVRGAARRGPRGDRDRQRGRGPPGRACARSAPPRWSTARASPTGSAPWPRTGVDLGLRHLGQGRAARPRRADGLPGEGDHDRRLRRRPGARRHVHLRRRPGRREPAP